MSSTTDERLQHVHDSSQRNFECFMTFSTPLTCRDCDTLTTWGHVERVDGELRLSPMCPLHGLARRCNLLVDTSEAQRELLLVQQEIDASIARFVLSLHDELGLVDVVAEIDASKAPGYHVFQVEDFEKADYYEQWKENYYPRAWSVAYTVPLVATRTHYIVVWDEFYSMFHLCAQDGSCIPPQRFEEGDDETMHFLS